MSSFLRLVEELLREPGERAAFLDDPSGYLPSRGFAEFSADDVELSLQLASDSFPPALAERIDPSAGLNTVTDIDIADVAGLWAPPNDGALGLEEIAMEDIAMNEDPFFDDADPLGDEHDLDDQAPEELDSDAQKTNPDDDVADFDGGSDLGALDQMGEAADGLDPVDALSATASGGLTELTAEFDVEFDELPESDPGHGGETDGLDPIADVGGGDLDDFDGLDG